MRTSIHVNRRIAAIAALAVAPLIAMAQGAPEENAQEVDSTITIRRAGNELEFVNPDGKSCRGKDCSFAISGSSRRRIQAISWETDFQDENVTGLRIRFKRGLTPFYRGGRNDARDNNDLAGSRRGKQFRTRGRIKPRGWRRRGLQPILSRGREERFSYSVEVLTDQRRYFVDPIIIVRR